MATTGIKGGILATGPRARPELATRGSLAASAKQLARPKRNSSLAASDGSAAFERSGLSRRQHCDGKPLSGFADHPIRKAAAAVAAFRRLTDVKLAQHGSALQAEARPSQHSSEGPETAEGSSPTHFIQAEFSDVPSTAGQQDDQSHAQSASQSAQPNATASGRFGPSRASQTQPSTSQHSAEARTSYTHGQSPGQRHGHSRTSSPSANRSAHSHSQNPAPTVDDFFAGIDRPLSTSQLAAEALRRTRQMQEAVQHELEGMKGVSGADRTENDSGGHAIHDLNESWQQHQETPSASTPRASHSARTLSSTPEKVPDAQFSPKQKLAGFAQKVQNTSIDAGSAPKASHPAGAPSQTPQTVRLTSEQQLLNLAKSAQTAKDKSITTKQWLLGQAKELWRWFFAFTAPPLCVYIVWIAAREAFLSVPGLRQIHTWALIAGLIVMITVTGQTRQANEALRYLHNLSVFATFGQAKRALSFATWSSIGLFYVLVFAAGSF